MKNYLVIIFIGRANGHKNHFRNESHIISMYWLCFHIYFDISVFSTYK